MPLPLQVSFEQFEDAPVLIHPGIGSAEAVPLDRVHGYFPVFLAQFDQPLGQPDRVLEVDVRVHDPVTDQESPLESRGLFPLDRREDINSRRILVGGRQSKAFALRPW